MIIHSFIQSHLEFLPVEVEVNLIPGLPKIEILGLPDAAIKESQWRIRSALRSQGFQLPASRQLLVNLRPTHLRKHSKGLELAIACAYLWLSEQVAKPDGAHYVYGELGLDGSVFCPEDIKQLLIAEEESLLTGKSSELLPYASYQISKLQDLSGTIVQKQKQLLRKQRRPELENILLSAEQAEYLKVCALGEHSSLLLGPAGSGKTTAATALHSLLKPLSEQQFKVAERVAYHFGKQINWRPLVMPHHSIPAISMLGGGTPIRPGEITRAHLGLLVLDEVLEFKPYVLESLREPISHGVIHVSRRGKTEQLPAQFMLAATSNLCPCGQLEPNQLISCNFSQRRCRSSIEKLSGPFLDRFDILAFTGSWSKQSEIKLIDVLKDLNKIRTALGNRGNLNNSQLPLNALKELLASKNSLRFMPDMNKSKRRLIKTLQLAKTYADLNLSDRIENEHINSALKWSFESHKMLQNIFK